MPTVALMPGTGSDADYLRRSFGPAVAESGWRLEALEPSENLVEHYLTRLDALAERGPLIVGGVSIGAAVGVRWAIDAGPGPCAGVLAALPPWSGVPGDSLAALSARITADSLERDGLEATVAAMAADSPDWLAAELSRSWRALAPRGLVAQLRSASSYTAPTLDELSGLHVPLAVAGAPDDPLHPIAVARAWTAAAPRAALTEIPLELWGPEERLLGDACVSAWRRVVR
ncbi:MAG: alpha/beta hydrolase [Gordonia sp. (in: high G+C Gram-positive bacteria)]